MLVYAPLFGGGAFALYSALSYLPRVASTFSAAAFLDAASLGAVGGGRWAAAAAAVAAAPCAAAAGDGCGFGLWP